MAILRASRPPRGDGASDQPSGFTFEKMAWLLPQTSRAIPYLGYVLVSSRKSATQETT
jgi:hypothetical protein